MYNFSHLPQVIKTYANFWNYFPQFPGSKLRILQPRSHENKYWVNLSSNDHWMLDDIYLHKDYSFIASFWKDIDIVVDVGAHIGGFTGYVADSVDLVLAVEPNPDNVRLLRKNISLNNLSNKVVIDQSAISYKNGQELFYLSPSGSGGGSLFKEGDKKILVKTKTLKSILNQLDQAPDLLKLDCEGAEYLILEYSKETLKKFKYIIIEYHPSTDTEIKDNEKSWIQKYFKELGYALLSSSKSQTSKGVLFFEKNNQ